LNISSLLFCQSAAKGMGLTGRATSAVRMNLSVALVRTLNDAIRVVKIANDTARDEVRIFNCLTSEASLT
jgi:hypothetical protein